MERRDGDGRAAWQRGDVGVYPGIGLVTVEGTEARDGRSFLLLRARSNALGIGLPLEHAAGVLRRPLPREEATRLVQVLRSTAGDPDERHAAYRHRDLQRTLVRGTFEEQVRALQRQYRARFKLSFGERKRMDTYETAVVHELAHVLGLEAPALIAELHQGSPAFAADAPARPAEPPLERAVPPSPVDLAGYDYLGPFQVQGGALVVGEHTASAMEHPDRTGPDVSLTLAAANGTWHAFGQGEDQVDGLVAVHESRVARLEEVGGEAQELGRVLVEGGCMSLLDAAVRDESAFIDEAQFPLFAAGLLLGRGCHCRTDGDGVFAVYGTREGGEAVFVAVDFGD